MKKWTRVAGLANLLCALALSAFAQQPTQPDLPSNLPKNELAPNFKAPVQASDYDKRVVMINLRECS